LSCLAGQDTCASPKKHARLDFAPKADLFRCNACRLFAHLNDCVSRLQHPLKRALGAVMFVCVRCVFFSIFGCVAGCASSHTHTTHV
jgi:hypothetical protein